MKKNLLFLLTVVSISATALQAQNQSFTQSFDSVFQYVNRVDARTGILYNRVIPFSRLYRFQQPDTANATIFIQAYSELYKAAFYPSVRSSFFPIFALYY